MKIYPTVIFLLIVNISFGQRHIERLDRTKISEDDLTKGISQIVDNSKITGLSIIIINDSKVVYQNYFGTKDKNTNKQADVHTVFYAASLTKPLFTYTFLKLVDKKIFALDTPIYKYLKKTISEYPKWKDLSQENDFHKITPRMLLSHSSGLPILRQLYGDTLRLISKPSEKFYYSNEGMNLLGFVVEEFTSKKLEILMKELAFDPLNMNRSSMIWNKDFETNYAYGYNYNGELVGAQKRESARAAGSMVTTVNDYAQFMIAMLKKIGLSRTSFKQMLKPQISIKSLKGFGPLRDTLTTQNDKTQLAWGLGWGLFQSEYGKAFFHAGNADGWKNYCVAYPKHKIAIILLSNSDNANPLFGKIINLAIKDTSSPLDWLGCYDNN